LTEEEVERAGQANEIFQIWHDAVSMTLATKKDRGVLDASQLPVKPRKSGVRANNLGNHGSQIEPFDR